MAVPALLIVGVLSSLFVGKTRQDSREGLARRARTAVHQALLLVTASIALAVGVHATDDTRFLRNSPSARYVAAANVARFFPKATQSDVRRFIDEGRGMIIDARFPAAYQAAHVPGAINVPVNSTTTERQHAMAGARHETPLLVYCQNVGCDYDEQVAALLARDGFERVSLFPGGWVEWHEHEHVR